MLKNSTALAYAVALGNDSSYWRQFERQRTRFYKRAAYSAIYQPNGDREVARRKRQIAAGQLRVTDAN